MQNKFKTITDQYKEDFQFLENFLLTDLKAINVSACVIYGSYCNKNNFIPEKSDIDIIVYLKEFTKENEHEIVDIIKNTGADFFDRPPIILKDYIADRIEFYLQSKNVLFDVTILPNEFPKKDNLTDFACYDSLELLTSAIYLRGIPIYGDIPDEEYVKENFLPFYSDDLRSKRLKIMTNRINKYISNIENYALDDNSFYVNKIKDLFTKWLYIFYRKYPINLYKNIEESLRLVLDLPEEEILLLVSPIKNEKVKPYLELVKKYLSKQTEINEETLRDESGKSLTTFRKNDYFGDYKQSNASVLVNYIKDFDVKLNKIYNFGYPFTKYTEGFKYIDYIESLTLNNQSLTPEEILDYMVPYFGNIPNYNNPGTMINVIPTPNLVSLACSTLSSLFNSNFAQDTYAGLLIAAEFEVSKYMSDLIGWDYLHSRGIFTFGGKGTNMYATKMALNKAVVGSKKAGINSNCFMITSTNCHPCHYEVCDWLGIGSQNCIEISCDENGQMNMVELEEVICQNIEAGKIFVGYNINGGSTNEFTIDPIKKVYELNQKIVKKYNLDYRPHIHVDFVIGYVFLFYNSYDFTKNPLNINKLNIKKLKKQLAAVSEAKYADTVGIDFHKMGYAPYTSSMILIKDEQDVFNLSEKKPIKLADLYYGNYNPYEYTLELSRPSTGAVNALVSLKSLGVTGIQSAIADTIAASDCLKTFVSKCDDLILIEQEGIGFALFFVVKPPKFKHLKQADLYKLKEADINEIKSYNEGFASYLSQKAKENKATQVFTISRSYTLPKSDIKIGALKIYPMSVFLNDKVAEEIASSIAKTIAEYKLNKKEMDATNTKVISDELVYRK